MDHVYFMEIFFVNDLSAPCDGILESSQCFNPGHVGSVPVNEVHFSLHRKK